MVEIKVTVTDEILVHSLIRRLRRLFDPSAVIYDATLKQVRVRSEWESRSVVEVVDSVQKWMEESGAASASLAVGDRSYTLLSAQPTTSPLETEPDIRALATISAVVRSAHGADDTATLLGRMCESMSEVLGFERAGIARSGAAASMAEAMAAHGWTLEELTEFAASAEAQEILRAAKSTTAVVLAHGISPTTQEGTIVVVPLVAVDQCHGFLVADHNGSAFDLEASERVLLATLGTVISAFLEKSIAHDGLEHAGDFKSNFIALASHELRTPTAAVCGIATTLHLRGDVLTADQRRALSTVLYEEGERLHRLVDQLLDLSRLEAASIRVTPSPLPVRDRIEDIVRSIAADRADEIEIRIDAELLMDVDGVAFDRIVSNLIANALRYGLRPIAVSASAHDRHFRLAVEDHGPGVPDTLEPQLFDRFTRGDNAGKSGAGLGLSIARAYAHAHGGELLYQHASPHGARFELVVPILS
jgi:signal transduction histidine kinase